MSTRATIAIWKNVVLLEIERAFRHPVRFQGHEYVHVGSYKKNLKDHPEKERELWRALDRAPFETGTAVENRTRDEILELLFRADAGRFLQPPMEFSRRSKRTS